MCEQLDKLVGQYDAEIAEWRKVQLAAEERGNELQAYPPSPERSASIEACRQVIADCLVGIGDLEDGKGSLLKARRA